MRVCQRVAARDLVHRRTHQEALHRHLEDLSGQRARDLGSKENLVGNVPWRAVLANPSADFRLEAVVERGSVTEDDEQRHLAPLAAGMSTTSASRTSSSARTLRYSSLV